MRRLAEPEYLDDLPPDDPRAIGSRADLRLLNRLMGHVGILGRAGHVLPAAHYHGSRCLRLVELGAGDGSLLLRLAHRWSGLGLRAEATLVDRQGVVSKETQRAFAALRWRVECVASDAFAWLERPAPVVDVMIANLFLHHFRDELLATLLRLAATRTNRFLACEPRRSVLGLAAARCLAIVGCNAVTRHDAMVSVRAGFVGDELSALWPKTPEWELSEGPVGLFSHALVAQRNV